MRKRIMQNLSLLAVALLLSSCASQAVHNQSGTSNYREIPASGKINTGDVRNLNASGQNNTNTAGYARVSTPAILSNYIGRRLLTGQGDYRLLLKDGTLVGESSDQTVTGKWQLDSGYLCYAEGPANGSQAKKQSDCVIMEVNDTSVRMTAARGKGRSTDYFAQ